MSSDSQNSGSNQGSAKSSEPPSKQALTFKQVCAGASEAVNEAEGSYEEEVSRRTYDPDCTLYMLKGTTRIFNYVVMLEQLKTVEPDVERVHIKSNGRPATFGFVVFKNKAAVDRFVKNKCTVSKEHEGYTYTMATGEYVVFRDYAADHVSQRNENKEFTSRFSRPVKKLFVTGLPLNDTQAFLTKFFNDCKVEVENMTLRFRDTGAMAEVFVKDGADGLKLIERSYNDGGIKCSDATVKVRRFNQRRRPPMMHRGYAMSSFRGNRRYPMRRNNFGSGGYTRGYSGGYQRSNFPRQENYGPRSGEVRFPPRSYQDYGPRFSETGVRFPSNDGPRSSSAEVRFPPRSYQDYRSDNQNSYQRNYPRREYQEHSSNIRSIRDYPPLPTNRSGR
jgi:hypothetical protein